MIQYNLVKNAISAYFAAIEIHNKPHISYRYETVTLLLMNAWELALKAYIRKYLRFERSIFDKSNHTITFDKALDYVSQHMNIKKTNAFIATKENLTIIGDFRNDIMHFYCEDLLPCIFTLVSRCALNFVDFISKYFNRNIIDEEGLFILPIGFKLPFNPEEFLSKASPIYSSSYEAKKFVDQIVNTISSLKDDGIEESIVLGFDVYLQTVKKPSNSDLLLKITSGDSTTAKISTIKTVRLSNDPNAQGMKFDDDTFLSAYPHTYKKLTDWCRENIPTFIQGMKFNMLMKTIKQNKEYSSTRFLNPQDASSIGKTFYNDSALHEIKRQFELNNMVKTDSPLHKPN